MSKPCKHLTCWVIAGGAWLWCYKCGSIRPNRVNGKHPIRWQSPSHDGKNPAMADKYPAQSWDKDRRDPLTRRHNQQDARCQVREGQPLTDLRK